MANLSAIKLPNGTTYNLKDSVSGYITDAGVTGVKGNSESTYRTGQVNLTAANIGAVATSGNETIAGNKTFSGTTSLTAASTYPAPQNTIITPNAGAIIQSPIPKYLWHDIIAFCKATTPTYYTTTNGSTWTTATLEKRLFAHMNNWGNQQILNSSIQGSRWVWHGGSFAYSSLSWIVLGITYNANIATFDLLLETTADATASSPTWTTLCSVTGAKYNQQPIWIKASGPSSTGDLRLTITRTSGDTTTNVLPLCAIEFLTTRWGDQGKGVEFEYPYNWDGIPNIYPIQNNVSNLGSSSNKWANIYATTFTGNLTGNVTGNVTGTATGNVTSIQYDSTNTKLTYTKNGTNTDIVTVATLKSALGSMPASDVYSWAKASTKPSYTASEVGALASNTTYVSTVSTSAGTHSAISSKSGAVSFNVPTKTSHLTNDSGFITNAGVTSVTTTAGAHTTISSATGAVSFKVPTKTSHLTNDSGYLTSHQTIKQDGVTGATANRFGTCGTAAGTAAKTVSVTTGTPTLETGLRVTVKFSNANTANSPTLNVNSLGAKNIYHNGAQITSGANKALLAGTVEFVYDGTQWQLVGNYVDTNTTYTVPTTAANAKTNISIANHGTTSIGSASNWSAGSASTWAFSGVTVANSISGAIDSSDSSQLNITLGTTTVQSKSSGSNSTVPSLTITSTTVVNGNTHSITDNGHTHTLS